MKNGGFDQNKVALVITQTGGGCRASNYYFLLQKHSEVQHGTYPHHQPQFKGWRRARLHHHPFMPLQSYSAFLYGDTLMALSNQVRP